MKAIRMIAVLLVMTVCTADALPIAFFEGPLSPAQELKVRPISEFEVEKLPRATILWNPDFKDDMRLRYRVRAALLFDFEIIEWQVSPETWRRLGDVRIVISPKTEGSAAERLPNKGRGSAFHFSATWLKDNGFDAEREGAIEIHNATDFLTNKPVFPMVLVHELTHRLQYVAQQARPVDPIVGRMMNLYRRAIETGKGEKVAHILAPHGELKQAPWVKTRWTEYFANLSEAFLGRDQYYPFTREDLIAYDRETCDVVAQLWAMQCTPRGGTSRPGK